MHPFCICVYDRNIRLNLQITVFKSARLSPFFGRIMRKKRQMLIIRTLQMGPFPFTALFQYCAKLYRHYLHAWQRLRNKKPG